MAHSYDMNNQINNNLYYWFIYIIIINHKTYEWIVVLWIYDN